ncbi:MAG: hypothetical protein ACON4C_07480 [Henriciella sp.]
MRLFPVFLAVIALSACSTATNLASRLDTRQNVGVCPPAGALYNAARIVSFDAETELYTEITYSGEITGVRLFCRYTDDDPISAEIEIDFAFGRGPKGKSRQHDYTYWVAVTRRSGKVLDKVQLTVPVQFDADNRATATELIEDIEIPRADETISGANFEVVVGFELTEAERRFNEEGRRFRLQTGT